MSESVAPTRRESIVALLIAIAICFGASAIGGLATATSVESWYLQLERPWFTPPSWVFAPVWSLLYLSMAVAAWDVWRVARHARVAWFLFAVQLMLNVLWSVSFFGLRSPALGLLVIALLIVAIALTIFQFARYRRRAGYLLVPYLLWVCFASLLNASFWWLNR